MHILSHLSMEVRQLMDNELIKLYTRIFIFRVIYKI